MNRVFVILLLLPCAMWAQDVHFTQWMHNPLFSNPAATVFFFMENIKYMGNNDRNGLVLVYLYKHIFKYGHSR